MWKFEKMFSPELELEEVFVLIQTIDSFLEKGFFEKNIQNQFVGSSQNSSNKVPRWTLFHETESEIWAALGQLDSSEFLDFLSF